MNNWTAYGQSFKAINESEWNNVYTGYRNPDNINEEPVFRNTSVLTADHSWFFWKGYLKSDFRLSYLYDHVNDNAQNINNHAIKAEPIEFYYNLFKGNWTFALGRKKVRFGVGYVASPTDIISRPTTFDDPSDRLYRILGNDLAQATYTKESWQADFYYLPKTPQNTLDYFQDHSFALRYYKFFGKLELTAMGRASINKELQAGFNSTYTIGQKLELHSELLFQKNNYVLYPVENEFIQKDNSVYRFLFGGQWSPNANWNIALEYFALSEGYNESEWQKFNTVVNQAGNAYLSSNSVVSTIGAESLDNINQHVNFPMRKHYIFLRVVRKNVIKKIDVEYLAFSALNEIGILHRLAINYDIGSALQSYIHFQHITNKPESSFSILNYTDKVRIGILYNFSIRRNNK